jgi:hypothetical protein
MIPFRLNPKVLRFRLNVRVHQYFLGKGGNVVACVALSSQVKRIFLQIPGIVLEKVGQKVYEMVSRLWSVVNNRISVVC